MVPAYLRGYVSDASLPASASAAEAIETHREQSPYDGLVGALVVTDTAVADVVAALDDRPLSVDLAVTGGAGAIEPAVIWAGRAPGLSLRTLGFTLRDEDDLAHNARRLCAAVDSLEERLSGVGVFAEPPRLGPSGPSYGWLGALDELASREHGLILRLDQPAGALATAVDAALDRELPLRGAGAAGPVTDDRATGFVNLLLAVRAAWDGEDATSLLGERDPAVLREAIDEEALERARRWCTGVVAADPVAAASELAALGLLPNDQPSDQPGDQPSDQPGD